MVYFRSWNAPRPARAAVAADVPLNVVVAVNTQRIEQLEGGFRTVDSKLTRIEDKVDRIAEARMWTPGAKATVWAAGITATGGLVVMAVLNGGPS